MVAQVHICIRLSSLVYKSVACKQIALFRFLFCCPDKTNLPLILTRRQDLKYTVRFKNNIFIQNKSCSCWFRINYWISSYSHFFPRTSSSSSHNSLFYWTNSNIVIQSKQNMQQMS